MPEHTVTSGGLRIRVTEWPASGASRGDVLLLHGLAEHMGRYEHIAAALSERGWRVVGPDLRGHGRSDGKRGHVDAWTDYLEDVRAVESLLGDSYVILGHSMGGLIALDHLRTSDRVRAAALNGALLQVAVPVSAFKRLLVHALDRVLPRLSVPTELDPALLTHDEEVVQAYRDDPLVYRTITLRWATEMERAAERVMEHAPRYTTPLRMSWGSEDQIVSTDALAHFTLRCPVASAHPEAGLLHEVFNEPEGARVLEKIADWLGEV